MRLAFFLLASSILCLGGEVDRLVTTGRLWYAVKQFHPNLAHKDIDWEQALVNAIPKIRSASNAEEFASGVQGMLAALNDPSTRVTRKSSGKASGEQRWFDIEKRGGVMIARFRPQVEPGMSIMQAGTELEKSAEGAEALIFDLRSTPEASEASLYVSILFGEYMPYGRKLITAPLAMPGLRSRYLDAFEPGFRIAGDPPLAPAGGAKERPLVFVVNRHTQVPQFALATQAAGKAAIVFDGEGEMTAAGGTISVPLEDAWVAVLRTSEVVMPDGTGLPEAALRVADGDALEAAVRLTGGPLPAVKPGAPLPGVAQPRAPKYSAGFPPVEERLLAAFEIWGTFHYLSAYPHLMDDDWTEILRRSIPDFVKAEDERSHALAVAKMVAQVRDTHASVNGRSLNEHFGTANVPVLLQYVEGKPAVVRVVAGGEALRVGDVIVRVDGRSVAERERELTPYFAASTPQSMRYRLAQRLLWGADGSTAKLVVHRAGKELTVDVARGMAHLAKLQDFRDGEVVRWAAEGIGYADLDRLETKDVDAMFEKFREAKAIVFDMRGYPNGTAWSIAPRLTERRDVAAASFRRPNWTGPDYASSDIRSKLDYRFEQYLPATDKWRYKGQTVVLIDERAISQSEHSCLFYRAANGSKFIGSPTTGANGDVRNFSIPGGIRINYSGHDVRHIDGAQLQRVGIQPDVPVTPTVDGIRAGKDEVLERAIEYLRSGR